jgi:hypothetical protein
MPDYEIRLYHRDGSLALVHVSHHETDEDAHAQARQLREEYLRYELRRDGEVIKETR